MNVTEKCHSCNQVDVTFNLNDLEEDEMIAVCDGCWYEIIDNQHEPVCEYCDDLGGNRYDDGVTPCPYCRG